jgi:protease-4
LWGGGGGGAGAHDIVEAVDRAAEDSGVKAIVLRIDSPGGDALASDLIWHAVMKAREKKPVVASMGDVAASGGYYVASAANTIFAEPNTITGSIGVFGLMFNAERLADDAGVRTYSLQRGALPGPSLLHGLSDEERAALQASVNNTYEQFLDAVITGRGKTAGLEKDKLRDIAEGHVWTGKQALERKLVDNMGGIAEALQDAKKRANLGDDEEVGLDVITGHEDDLMKMTGLVSVFGGARAAAIESAARLLLGDPDAVAFLLTEKGRPMAVAPVTVRVR